MDSQKKSTEPVKSYSGRNLFLIFIVLSAGILVVGALIFRATEKNFRNEIDQQLSSIADLRARDLVLWRKERLGDGNVLFKNSSITQLAGQFIKKAGDPSARKQLLMWFGKEEKAYNYDGVWLLDGHGATRLASRSKNGPASSVVSKNVPEVLKTGQVVLQDLYLDERDQHIYMDVLVPLFEDAKSPRPLGVIDLRINPDYYLYPNLKQWPGETKTGETGLFRREGDEAVLLSESRFQKGTALTRRAPMTRTELPAIQALLGKEGIVEAVGFQKAPVVAALKKVPDSPWVLVVRRDTSELNAPMRSRIGEIIAAMVLMLFAAGAGVGLVWREQQAKHYKEKAESQRFLSYILEQTTDGVVVVDSDLMILGWNKGAEKILGYTAQEILGKSAKLLDAEQGPGDVAQKRQEVKEAGTTINYEALRRAKDGRLIHLDISSTPLKDESGRFIGYSAIYRDISEKLKAQENQRMLANILEQTSDGVVVVDLEGRIIKWNRGAEKVLGYRPEEVLGKPSSILDPVDQPGAVLDMLKTLRETRKTIHFETFRKKKDGKSVRLFLSSTPLQDQSGKLIGYSAVFRDITEELKAKETQRLLATILDQTPDAVLAADMNEVIIQWNQGAERMFSYSTEEALGKSLSFLVPDHLSAEAAKGRQTLKSGGITHAYETTRKRKDGSLIQVEISAGPIRDPDGKMIGFSAIYRDITENLKAQESQRLLASILEQTPDAVILSDLGSVTRQWNKGAERILGYSAEEAIGKSASMMEPKEQAGRIHQTSQELLSGTDSLYYERVLIRKDGKPVDVAVTRFKVNDREGKIVGSAAIVRDITERKRIEAELEKYQAHLEKMVETRTAELEKATKAAETANQAKSSFLANMSHEIRTPMNAILGFAQLLRRDPALTPQQDQQVDVIFRSGSNLLTLINEILDYSKIEANRLSVESASFDLHGLLMELDSVFKAKAQEKGLRLLVEKRDLLPRFVVGDETKIRQILINLLSNAMKFTERGGVALRVAIQPGMDGDGSDQLVAEVEDSGSGIAPEEMVKLFKVFEQTESGRKAKSGTGLGLAISRKFAELMGGTLKAESQFGKGSTFRLELPVREGTDTGSAQKRRRVEGLEPGQPKWRVLVVDDNLENRGYLETLFNMVGFDVRSAVDGQQGVQEFKTYEPHLILMDLRMPVMEGPEAIRRIRAMERGDKVKIIAVSASSFKEDQKKALKVGADDFISKPFREETLFERMQEFLGVKFKWSEEKEKQVKGTPEPPPEDLEKDRVALLPTDLRDQLRQALQIADLDTALSVLGKMSQHDAGAAAALRTMAGKFEYQRILELLRVEGDGHEA